MPTRKDRGFRLPMDKYSDEIAEYTNWRYLEQYLNYIRKKDIYGTTFVVASSTSDRPERAHYQCDGVADDVQIQEALDALPAAGGRIVLLEGTFNITATLALPNKDVILCGPGTLDFDGDTTAFGGGVQGSGGRYTFLELEWIGAVRDSVQTTRGAALTSMDGEWLFLGNHFHDLSANFLFGNKSLGGIGDWIVVGNDFANIELRRSSGASDNAAIIAKDEGGSREARGVFAGNFIDTVTVSNGGDPIGANWYLGYSQDTASAILFTSNIIENPTGLTANFGGAGLIATHNLIDGVMVGGDHTGVDHGTLSGLTDDDHTQYVLRSILTTKGDLFVRNASAVTRLPVGTDGTFLQADSTDAEGMVWAEVVTDPLPQILMLGGM